MNEYEKNLKSFDKLLKRIKKILDEHEYKKGKEIKGKSLNHKKHRGEFAILRDYTYQIIEKTLGKSSSIYRELEKIIGVSIYPTYLMIRTLYRAVEIAMKRYKEIYEKFGETKNEIEYKILDEDIVYEITRNDATDEILVNNIRFAKPQFQSENNSFFKYVYEHPN